MIAGNPRTTCPHCGSAVDGIFQLAQSFWKCAECGFVFPANARIPEIPPEKDQAAIPVERYRLVTTLQTHGPTRVYLARHCILDEPCVIKLLSMHPEIRFDDASRKFRDEAKAGFRIKHPHVARVHDCDRAGDQWYFVMEYVDGANLFALVQQNGPLHWMQVATLGQQAARGLAAIHREQLLHRDIKPSNLMLGADGNVKISDLGLVTILREAGVCDGPFGPGTPQYMAPEQLSGNPIDERSDIYSLGATLFHLLVGSPPKQGSGPLDYLTPASSDVPISWPDETFPPIPRWLRQIVEKCLAPDPKHRYDDADDLADDLADWLGSSASTSSKLAMAGVGTPKGLAILPFTNLSGDRKHEWIGNAVADEIQNGLIATEGTQVVDRLEVLGLIGRMYTDPGVEVTLAAIIDAARRTGAAIVVKGTYQVAGTRVKITASRFDIDHPGGKPLATCHGPLSDIIELQGQLVHDVGEALGHTTHPSADGQHSDGMDESARRCYADAKIAFANGRHADAVVLCREGLETSSDSFELLSMVGVCLSRIGKHDEALTEHPRLEELARDDPYRQMEVSANFGVMFYYKGDYAKALELLQKAGELGRRLNILPQLAKNCNNLGFVLSKMERFTDADRAFEDAINIKLSIGATASLISSYNGRGHVAMKIGRYRDAQEFFLKALQWSCEMNDPVQVGICHTHIGTCFVHMRKPAKADQHLRQAIEAFTPTDFWNGQSAAYEQLAELRLKRGDVDGAFAVIDKRIEVARQHKSLHTEAAAWEQKARAFELKGESDEALACLRKSLSLQKQDG